MAFSIQSLAPWLGATGHALVNLDEDTNGAEDFAGALLIYVADVIAAVTSGGDLPELPEAIKRGTTEKIAGAFRATLIVVSSVLAFAQFQVSGKAATILKYASQALSQLLAGRPVAPISTL